MNKKTLITVGIAALAVYYLYRWNKKPKSIMETPAETPVETPIDRKMPTNPAQLQTQASTEASFYGANGMVFHKRPIRIPATNLNPSIYDREVGMELAVSADGSLSEFYNNMGGRATESMKNACKCADTTKIPYKLDIPEIL